MEDNQTFDTKGSQVRHFLFNFFKKLNIRNANLYNHEN